MKYLIEQPMPKAVLWGASKPLLAWLDIELTERCNNNCIHCYINLPVGDLEAKQKELSTEELKKIIAEAVSLGCLSLRFTGGEPLLRGDFEELYIFARKSGLKVMIFTNATLITPSLAKLFSHIPPLEKIEVTVYGMKESSYQAVTRVPGSFAACRKGINLLLEHKIPFVVKGALLPQNKEELDEFERWAATIPWMNKPPAYSMFFDLRCRRQDETKNESIKNLRLKPQDSIKMISRRKNEYLKEMKDFCSRFVRPPQDNLFSCGAGNSGCLDAYGYFQPCIMLRHPVCVYDLKNGSLKDALTNFFPQLSALKAQNPDYLKRCAKCFLKSFCQQCPARSWIEHGTLDTPVGYFCDIAHAQARFLGLLEANEMGWQVREWRPRIDKFVQSQI